VREGAGMRILHLTLKKRWFDMIASGKKKEEYREVKTYWMKRLKNGLYDAVRFRNGYMPDSPEVTVELKKITQGIGYPQWGAPTHPVFILHLGEIINEASQ
jgi:hypothetical protein